METESCALAPSHWTVKSIEDVCFRVTSGATPSRREPAFYENGRWPWVKTQELRDEWIDDTEEHITDDAIATSSAKLLPENTVLVAMYGATVGKLGVLRRPMACNQACSALVVDPAKADFRFLFFQLLQARAELKSLATGAAQQNLSGVVIKALRIPFPPLPEQRAMAHILGALDDKIELNRRMNQTLDAMARALFKSWFVDFDPVRAKAQGLDPGLSTPLADVLPNCFEESELGGIPTGWTVGSILDQARLMSGGTPKTDRPEYWGGSIPWASAKDVSQSNAPILVDTERTITPVGLDESATQMIPAFSSVVVARGATTGRMVLLGRDMAMNQTCYALATTTNTPFALYCRLCTTIDSLVHAAHGSVFDTITTSTFASSRIVLPPRPVLMAFEERIAPVFQRLLSSVSESQTLASLRDALLPKLMRGELRVKDAETFIGRAAS